jgi:hypothetical protein
MTFRLRLRDNDQEDQSEIGNLIHDQEESELQPFLLLQYEHCVPNQKKLAKNLKLKRRIERDQNTANYVQRNYFENLFEIIRSKRDSNAPGDKCHLVNLSVNISDFGSSLSQRILLPSKIDLNRCVGRCNSVYSIDGNLEMSNHARLKQLYQ